MKREKIKGFKINLTKNYNLYICYYKNLFNILSITFNKNYTTKKYLYDRKGVKNGKKLY